MSDDTTRPAPLADADVYAAETPQRDDIPPGESDGDGDTCDVVAALAPCPFCGGGETVIHESGRVWTGTGYTEPVSVSVRHWCAQAAGQPSRMIERVGRDHESAIAAWNRRAPAAPAPFDLDAMLAACIPGGAYCDPQQIADAIRAYCARTPAPAAHAALSRIDADYWLARRAEIIDALAAEGLQIMSDASRVWLERTKPTAPAALAEALDPNEDDPAALWAEISRLRAAVEGPRGYASWQDAATDERVKRVRMADALRQCVAVLRDIILEQDPGDGNAPGHCHEQPGIWDDDNRSSRAGKPCEWCATWKRSKEALAAARAALAAQPQEKPPLGLRPQQCAEGVTNAARIDEICAALARYAEAKKATPTEWIAELQERIAANIGKAQPEPAREPSDEEIAAMWREHTMNAGPALGAQPLYAFARAVRAWPGKPEEDGRGD